MLLGVGSLGLVVQSSNVVWALCCTLVGVYGLLGMCGWRLWTQCSIWGDLRRRRVFEELKASPTGLFCQVDSVALYAFGQGLRFLALPLLVGMAASLAGAFVWCRALVQHFAPGLYPVFVLLFGLMALVSPRWLAAWGLEHYETVWARLSDWAASLRPPRKPGLKLPWLWGYNPIVAAYCSRFSAWTFLGMVVIAAVWKTRSASGHGGSGAGGRAGRLEGGPGAKLRRWRRYSFQ